MDVFSENIERPLKVRKTRTHEFVSFYDSLKTWVLSNNRVPSLTTLDKDERKNAVWLGHQLKNMRFDRLCVSRRLKMNEVFTWDYCNYTKFNEMYTMLIEWKKNNERYPYYKSNDEKERMLANWCGYHRAMKNANELTIIQKDKLEHIDGWSWKEGFDIFHNELIIWINKHNKLPTSTTTDIHERRLATWCANVRKRVRIDNLDDYHKEILDKLEGWFWDRYCNSFQSLFRLLKEFIKTNNRYPTNDANDINENKLYKWYNKQRKSLNMINYDNRKLLETLPDWKWIEKKDPISIFNENYYNIIVWVNNNHRIPSSTSECQLEKQLGRLCKYYRSHKEQLDKEMIEKLKHIKGWYWDLYEHYNVSLDVIQKWIQDAPDGME